MAQAQNIYMDNNYNDCNYDYKIYNNYNTYLQQLQHLHGQRQQLQRLQLRLQNLQQLQQLQAQNIYMDKTLTTKIYFDIDSNVDFKNEKWDAPMNL